MRPLIYGVVATTLLAAATPSSADEHKLNILMGGSKVGESSLTTNPDGSFSSKAHMAIGTINIDSAMDGHLKGGRILDYTSSLSTVGMQLTIRFADGKVHAVVNGKAKDLPYIDKTGHLGGNYQPEFLVSSLLAAADEIGKNPATKETTIQSYFVDIATIIPLKVRLLQSKPVTVSGAKHVARRFGVSLGGVEAECDIDETNHLVGMNVPSQKLQFLAEGWTTLFEDPLTKFPELSQATYATITEHGVKMKTRDGVELVCDIVRPNDDQKHPAILARTPYGRSGEIAGAGFYASRGYAFIAQDCRGREDSAGDWDPFVNEGPDGYDTVQWVASQPWCNGNVGMIGGSYGGYVQWAAAVLHPPALKCIVPEVSPPDAMHNIPYDGGTFYLYADLWWAKIVAGKKTDFSGLKSTLPHPKGLTTLPLADVDKAVLGEKLDFFQKWLDRTTIGDWKGMDYTMHLADANVPALNISGTWDGDEIGTQMNWSRMRELHRSDQWLIFGPWVHAFNTNHSFGDVEYGPNAIIDLDSVDVRWFDTWLKGKNVGMDERPKVRLFVTGANKWIDLPSWPSPNMRTVTQFFTKNGLAIKPGPSQAGGYIYDPAKDTFIPKNFISMDSGGGSLKVGQDELKHRAHLLLKSAPMEKNTAIATPLVVNLNFTTSAADTDFYMTVLDVDPDGTMRVVSMPGKIRCSYIAGVDRQLALEPGRVYTASFGSWDFAHEFAKGHRMALLITSSMFPAYARNLGTFDPIRTATRTVVQKNQILMGGDHPSSVSYQVLWEK